MRPKGDTIDPLVPLARLAVMVDKAEAMLTADDRCVRAICVPLALPVPMCV
jgi:hypothetical protein